MLRRVRTSECSASGPRPSIEMLVVKTAWILSFILSRDGEDEKDEKDEDDEENEQPSIEMLVVKTGSFILSSLMRMMRRMRTERPIVAVKLK